MHSPTRDARCEFCSKTELPERSWYDFPVIAERRLFRVIGALGNLVPGYALIVTKEHIPSMAFLRPSEREQLYRLVDQVVFHIERIWQAPTIFEHGSCDESTRGGACIAHAHWHLVPGDWALEGALQRGNPVPTFEAFAAGFRQDRGYVFVQRPNKAPVVESRRSIQSQLLRRKLAQLLDREDEWDYAAFPFLDNLAQTVEELTTALGTSSGASTDDQE